MGGFVVQITNRNTATRTGDMPPVEKYFDLDKKRNDNRFTIPLNEQSAEIARYYSRLAYKPFRQWVRQNSVSATDSLKLGEAHFDDGCRLLLNLYDDSNFMNKIRYQQLASIRRYLKVKHPSVLDYLNQNKLKISFLIPVVTVAVAVTVTVTVTITVTTTETETNGSHVAKIPKKRTRENV